MDELELSAERNGLDVYEKFIDRMHVPLLQIVFKCNLT